MSSDEDKLLVEKLIRTFLQFREVGWTIQPESGYRKSEIKVLLCMFREETAGRPYMRVSQISQLLRVTAPTITQLLNSLEEEGLIERMSDESDRRMVLVKLTEKGKAVVHSSREEFFRLFSGLSEHLGAEDSRRLAELLSKAFQYFSEKTGDSSSADSFPKNGVDRPC